MQLLGIIISFQNLLHLESGLVHLGILNTLLLCSLCILIYLWLKTFSSAATSKSTSAQDVILSFHLLLPCLHRAEHKILSSLNVNKKKNLPTLFQKGCVFSFNPAAGLGVLLPAQNIEEYFPRSWKWHYAVDTHIWDGPVETNRFAFPHRLFFELFIYYSNISRLACSKICWIVTAKVTSLFFKVSGLQNILKMLLL